MKNTITILFAFLTSLSYVSGCSSNEIDLKHLVEREGTYYVATTNEPYSGVAFKYAKRGGLVTRSEFVDGKLEGFVTHYFSDGRVLKQVEYANGVENGNYKVWQENGTLLAEDSSNGGRSNGLQIRYKTDGSIERKIEYSEGGTKGISESYDNAGKIKKRETHINRQIDGLVQEWEDGVLVASSEYKNGKKHGLEQQWEDGILTKSVMYVDGDYDGLYQEWRKGVLVTSIEYANGKANGKSSVYNDSWTGASSAFVYDSKPGEFHLTNSNYVDGKLHGPIEIYKDLDKKILVCTGQFENGNSIGIFTTFFEDGKKKRETMLTSEGSSVANSWFSSGTPQMTTDPVSGMSTFFYTNGQIAIKENTDGSVHAFSEDGSPCPPASECIADYLNTYPELGLVPF